MTNKTPFEQVKEFYEAFNQALPEEGSQPSLTNELLSERLELKMDLIAEEFIELVEAVYGKKSGEVIQAAWGKAKEEDEGNRDVVETFDALADSIYVINGLAIEAGGDLDAVFNEVHSSNMSKLGDDGKPVLSDGVNPAPDGKVKPKGKILKSHNFREPDIKKVLGL